MKNKYKVIWEENGIKDEKKFTTKRPMLEFIRSIKIFAYKKWEKITKQDEVNK